MFYETKRLANYYWNRQVGIAFGHEPSDTFLNQSDPEFGFSWLAWSHDVH